MFTILGIEVIIRGTKNNRNVFLENGTQEGWEHINSVLDLFHMCIF